MHTRTPTNQLHHQLKKAPSKLINLPQLVNFVALLTKEKKKYDRIIASNDSIDNT